MSTDKILSDCPHVFKGILQVKELVAVDGVQKNGQNQAQGGNKYRRIEDVYQAVCAAEIKAKIVVIPFVHSRATEERGKSIHVILDISYQIYSVIDGSHVEMRVISEASTPGDKATGAAFTYAHKYALIQLYVIPVDGIIDSDADEPRKPAHLAKAPDTFYYDLSDAMPEVAEKMVKARAKEGNFDERVFVLVTDKKFPDGANKYIISARMYEDRLEQFEASKEIL